jgi:hypothetical protein
VDLTSDEIVTVEPVKGKRHEKQDEMKKFLTEILAKGPVLRSSVERAAQARGFSLKTLRRMGEELGVVITSEGFGKKKKSYWSLSKNPPSPSD